MGSGNKYGNSFMLTDKERNYLVNKINSVFSGVMGISKTKLYDLANRCASVLYVQYSSHNPFSKVNDFYEKAVAILLDEVGLGEFKERVVQESYIALSNLLAVSDEYNGDGVTRIGQDSLSIYLNK